MFESDVRVSRNSGIAVKTSSAALPNNSKFKRVAGSVCAPRGFRAAAVHCGIKQIGTGKGSDKGPKRDLGLIVSDIPATVAGTFTTNNVCAAPVRVSARVAARSTARAVVVNSGNANACTGTQGMRDANQTAALTARVVAAGFGTPRQKVSAGG
jgi:glutamate N-acetyltransferase/amino-acid N-acetyltransferase